MLSLKLRKEDIELIEFVRDADTETLVKGKDKNGIPYLEHIFRLHVLLFGETCTGCPSKIPNYIKRVKNYKSVKMATEENIKSEFRLRKGVIIPIPGSSKAFSEYNITDKNAIELLRQNPNRRSLFETVPGNLDELISEDSVDEVVSLFDNEFTIEEAKELLEVIGVKSNATTVKGINKKIESLNEEQLNELGEIVNAE